MLRSSRATFSFSSSLREHRRRHSGSVDSKAGDSQATDDPDADAEAECSVIHTAADFQAADGAAVNPEADDSAADDGKAPNCHRTDDCSENFYDAANGKAQRVVVLIADSSGKEHEKSSPDLGDVVSLFRS